MEWDHISVELRLLTDYYPFHSWQVSEYGRAVEWYWQQNPNYSVKILSHCHFVHCRSHCTDLGGNPGCRVCKHAISLQVLTRSVRYMYIKVKQSRYTPWRRLRGEEYRSYSFTTSALDGGEWLASRPGRALPLGKGPPVSIGQEAGWAPEPVWTQRTEEKSYAPAGDLTPIARSSSP
jgi:hypothetical protein